MGSGGSSAVGNEREEPQIFYADNLFHTPVEKPLEMYPGLCWNCLGTVGLAFLLSSVKALQSRAWPWELGRAGWWG